MPLWEQSDDMRKALYGRATTGHDKRFFADSVEHAMYVPNAHGAHCILEVARIAKCGDVSYTHAA